MKMSLVKFYWEKVIYSATYPVLAHKKRTGEVNCVTFLLENLDKSICFEIQMFSSNLTSLAKVSSTDYYVYWHKNRKYSLEFVEDMGVVRLVQLSVMTCGCTPVTSRTATCSSITVPATITGSQSTEYRDCKQEMNRVTSLQVVDINREWIRKIDSTQKLLFGHMKQFWPRQWLVSACVRFSKFTLFPKDTISETKVVHFLWSTLLLNKFVIAVCWWCYYLNH